MKYGSVCSGIEAATVAWHQLGWEPSWFSEIAMFPSAVLAYHYPHVPNLGDMTLIPDLIVNHQIEAPDILCGGTPCQAFSIAGMRQSLKDDRGNLSLVFCEVADAIDNVRESRGESPAIIVWENVPGVFSTSDNAFGCFLAGLAGESEPIKPTGKKWANAGIVVGPKRTACWRVLDAQYFGLAQRRKRVFVVASARDDIDIGQVLFEFDGVQRNTPPSRKKTETNTASTETGIDGNSRGIGFQEVSPTLRANAKQSLMSGSGNINAALVMNYSISSMNSKGMLSQNPDVGFKETDISRTLDTTGTYPAKEQGGNVIVEYSADLAPTMTASGPPYSRTGAQNQELDGYVVIPNHVKIPLALAFKVRGEGTMTGEKGGDISKLGQHGGSGMISYEEKTFTLATSQDQYVAYQKGNGVKSNMRVRRLTPKECERLQGFPDDYTKIPYRGKDADLCPDSLRYHALGNSWAVPVITWIGNRINKLIEKKT
jgi:DNA (cytosine-5)-methyltransferase 1